MKSEEREQRFVKIDIPVVEMSLICWKCSKPIMKILAATGASLVHGDVVCDEANGTHTFSDKQSSSISDDWGGNRFTMLVADRMFAKRSKWEIPLDAALTGLTAITKQIDGITAKVEAAKKKD